MKYLHIECTQEIYFKPLSAWHCAYCYMYIYVKVTECDHKHLMHGFIGRLDFENVLSPRPFMPNSNHVNIILRFVNILTNL